MREKIKIKETEKMSYSEQVRLERLDGALDDVIFEVGLMNKIRAAGIYRESLEAIRDIIRQMLDEEEKTCDYNRPAI